MLTQNAKMKKASLKTWNFDIPAIKTCPFANACKEYCYATKGFYKMPVVRAKHESNFMYTRQSNFRHLMNNEIKELRAKNKIDAIRIHSSGDFYSIEYILKWISIMLDNPDIIFYAYTKSVPHFQAVNRTIDIPDNFRLIYSKGGKYDHLIDELNLRSVSLVNEYSNNSLTSDSDDSMIIFSNENIELIKRKVS